MSDRDIALLVAAAVLVLIGGAFAGAESAFSRISRLRAVEMTREQLGGVVRLQQVLDDPARYLNLLTLLRVGCELAATVLVTIVCLDRIAVAWQAALLAGAGMTVVIYIVVGVAPRTLGLQHADTVARVSAQVVVPLARVLGPLAKLLIVLGNALTPGRGFRDGPFASEAELRDLVDLAQENRLSLIHI